MRAAAALDADQRQPAARANARREAPGDRRDTARSDSTTQRAAIMPPAKPIARLEFPDMDARERRAHRPDPPGLQTKDDDVRIGHGAGDTDDAAGQREHRRLGQEHPAHMRAGIPGRAQHADLPQPLLDAEAEEQHHQQQRRDDDEEAEVGEVLAEVGGAAEASSASRRTGRTAMPCDAGSTLFCSRSQRSLSAARSLRREPRTEVPVTLPYRVAHRSRARS